MVNSEWEMHFQDGRPYYYNITTQKSQWECPEGFVSTAEKVSVDEQAGASVQKGKNKVSPLRLELGPTSSTPSSEFVRAFQGGCIEMEVSSTVGDSGLVGGEATLTSGSPNEEVISGSQEDMAAAHLDQRKETAFSEGDAAVNPAVPDNQVRNATSAAEVLVVDIVPGSQGKVSEKNEGLRKEPDVVADDSSQPSAEMSAFLEKDLWWLEVLEICLTWGSRQKPGAPMRRGLMCQRKPGVQKERGLRHWVVHAPQSTATMGRRSL